MHHNIESDIPGGRTDVFVFLCEKDWVCQNSRFPATRPSQNNAIIMFQKEKDTAKTTTFFSECVDCDHKQESSMDQ